MMGKVRWIGAVIGISLCLPMVYGSSQDDLLNQPVTYDQPAQTVKQLLDALSRQTGVRLFAPNPIDSEIVLVIVREMPLKELMTHLAEVTDGEWFKQPDGSYRLVRSPKMVRERRAQDDEQILQELKRELERKEVKSMLEPLTEQQARQHRDKIKELIREITSQDLVAPLWDTPYYDSLAENVEPLYAGKRLMVRLMRQFDLRRLLEIPVGERRVFSNVRGRFLLPLGVSVESLIQQFVREYSLVHQLWTHPTDGLDKEQLDNFHRRYYYFIDDQWLRQNPPSHPPTRIYLEVYRWTPDYFECTVHLVADDMTEWVVSQATQWYLWASPEEQSGEQASPPAETPAQPFGRVEWSERSQQFIEAYRAMSRAVEPMPLPEILDPARTEPLSLIPTDVLRAFARQKGKQLVALLTDSDYVWWFDNAIEGRNELKSFMHEAYESEYFLREEPSLLLLKPCLSSYQWGQRMNRQGLSEWLRRILQKGYLGLEDYRTLARLLAHHHQRELPAEELYLSLVLNQPRFWEVYEGAMGFINSLTAPQLTQLRAGRELPLSVFAPAQREQLVRDLYFRPTRMVAMDIVEDERQATELIHAYYPDGLPPDTTIQLAMKTDELDMGVFTGVFTERKAGVWSGFICLSLLAYELNAFKSEQNIQGMDEESLRYMRERVAHYQSSPLMPVRRQPFILQVRLSEHRMVRLPMDWCQEWGDYELLNDGKPVTLDNLPKELKEQMEKYRQQFKTWAEEDES